VYVNAVFVISVQEENGEIELCHFTTEPIFPDKVNKPLVFPKQIIEPPVTFPATVDGLTVIVAGNEFSMPQLPL
jgi:hypothetical protein